MKAKEAIELIKKEAEDEEGLYKGLCEMMQYEIEARIKLRSHGKNPTDNLVSGVIDEVGDWGQKVGRGLDLDDKTIETAVHSERGAGFAKYRMVDLIAAKQMKQMRRAYLSGKAPIEVLTKEGLDAIGEMMIGRMMQEARELVDGEEGPSIGRAQHAKIANELGLSDKPFCPYGIEARHCKNCETLYSPTKEAPFPTCVEQLQFFCKADPKKCDWEGKK